jgi:hypothetical protein
MNAADLAVFDALFASIAEEMGAALERAASRSTWARCRCRCRRC